jgi:hypothetical protein
MALIDFEAGKQAIVQIYYSESDAIAGTGFWLGGRYLMTCAHVVGMALRLTRYGDAMGQTVRLVFFEAGQTQALCAEVMYCKYEDLEGGADVAVLRLAASACVESCPIRLATCFQRPIGAEIRTYGYLQGNRGGRNIEAVTNGSAARHWIQIESSKKQGMAIAEGLSGSPIWCEKTDAFVGMVVARDDLRPKDRIGFMIPAEHLRFACQLIQNRALLDILEPYEQRLADRFRVAYQLCRNRHAMRSLQSGLASILEDLATQGAGSEDSPNKLVQFVAGLLNDLLNGSERDEFEGLVDELQHWANELTDDLSGIMAKMRDIATAQQAQAIAPLNPVLLVSVYTEDIAGSPPFYVEAWLIADPEKYDPLGDGEAFPGNRGIKSVSLKGLGNNAGFVDATLLNEEIAYDKLPMRIAAYLDQICREGIDLVTLTVELFLPFALMNQPMERLGMSRLGFVEPLGIDDLDCPQVLLRSQDRLDQPRSHASWKKKWLQVGQNHQVPATSLLVADRRNLKRDLQEEKVLGIKLSASPVATNSGEIARLVISGAPLAVWVRDSPSSEALFQRLEQDVLAHPLTEFPARLLALRRNTLGLDNDADYAISAELGHHLAVLWENPKHVPPTYRYSASKL